jgi:hypothetical protein
LTGKLLKLLVELFYALIKGPQILPKPAQQLTKSLTQPVS